MASTNLLLNTIEWAKKLNFNRRSAIDNFLEPALTSANIVKQTMLGPPFCWRWNRVTTGFICTANVQDYVLTSWVASSAFALNELIVDTNGYSQQVSVAGTSGLTAPVWNTTVGGTTSDGSVTWTNLGSLGRASSTYSFGWIETASVQDLATVNAPAKWYEMDKKLSLALDSAPGRPRYVAADQDDGAGRITFRLMPVPDKAYPISLTLQQKPSMFNSVNQAWSPIPDEYSYIYNWGFLAMMYMFSDDPRFTVANQKFVAHLLGANQGLTETERSMFLDTWAAITGTQSQYDSQTTAQGIQGRGV